MNGDALGIGKRIAQFEKGDIGVLGYQFTKEPGMGCQLSAARWTPHRSNSGHARHVDLTSPTRTSSGGQLKAPRRFPP